MSRRGKPRAPPPEDREIDVTSAWDVLGWSWTLGVTDDQVREAIALVGPKVVDVKRHFGK